MISQLTVPAQILQVVEAPPGDAVEGGADTRFFEVPLPAATRNPHERPTTRSILDLTITVSAPRRRGVALVEKRRICPSRRAGGIPGRTRAPLFSYRVCCCRNAPISQKVLIKEGGVAGVFGGSMIFPWASPKSETTFVKQNRKLVHECGFRF